MAQQQLGEVAMDRELMATAKSDSKLQARILKMARHHATGEEADLRATVVMVAALFESGKSFIS